MHFEVLREITNVAAVKTFVKVVTMCCVCRIRSSEGESHFTPFSSLSTAWSCLTFASLEQQSHHVALLT